MIVLACLAGLLTGYLMTLTSGVWLFGTALLAVLVLVGLASWALYWWRQPQLSMRTLVCVFPVLTALGVLLVAELDRSRKRQALLAGAQVHAEFHTDGLYGFLNGLLRRNVHGSMQNTFPTDVRELYFELDCQHIDQLAGLPLDRLQTVVMAQMRLPTSTVSTSTLEWLNRLPVEVKIEFLCQPLPQADWEVVSKLERPMNRVLVVNTPALTLSDGDLTQLLRLPTKELSLSGLKFAVQPTLSLPATASEKLVLVNMPAAQAVQLAAWKKCAELNLGDASLTDVDCQQLAALQELNTLKMGSLSREHLQLLLTSTSLRQIHARVVGLSQAELQALEATTPIRVSLSTR